MPTDFNRAAKKRQTSPRKVSPKFWLPVPGNIVAANESGFEALTTGELRTGDRHLFEVRVDSGSLRLPGVVVWRRLHDLPVRGGHVQPRFLVGVRLEGTLPAELRPLVEEPLELAA